MISVAVLLPWALLAAALCGGLWLRHRYLTELAAHRAASERLIRTQTMFWRISQAVESTSDAIGIGDMEGNSLYHNRAHVDLFGYTVAQLNAVPESGVLFADKDVAREILAAVNAGRSWRGETDIQTRTGRRVPAFVRADIIRDEAGKPVGIYGVFADVTERRRAERQIEEERERLKVTLQSTGDGVITTDAAGRVALVNPVAEKLTGWSAPGAADRRLDEVLHPLDEHTRQPRAHPALAILQAGAGLPFAHTYLLVARDGVERVIAESTAFIRGADGKLAGAVQVLRDITQERQRAAEAERAGKLESLGLLAGGIAHDFGNLLTAMVGNLTLVQMSPGLSGEVSHRLAEMEKIVWRARDLTQGLKTFAKGGAPMKKRTRLGGLINESAQLAVQGAPVELNCIVPADLLAVEAEESQLGQVLHNIVLNAAQALPPGGRITIEAKNLAAGDDPAVRDGQRWVRIAIADNGPGISPEVLPKIFDPFFTTKKTGTGLGLATSYSIVEKHGGRLRVESVVGGGTTFRILLPAVPDLPEGKPGASGSGRRRLLLVDDERAVRESIALMLDLLGYEVVATHEGGDACTRYREALDQGRRFDAAILDLRTPAGPSGAETARRLRKMDANLRAVAISGYDDDVVMSQPEMFGFNSALAKPFKMDEIGGLLKELLDS